MRNSLVIAAMLAMLAQQARAAETFTVEPKTVADEKAVFATVESTNVVPARARIGGTVVVLAVKHGDAVNQGEVLRHRGVAQIEQRGELPDRSLFFSQLTGDQKAMSVGQRLQQGARLIRSGKHVIALYFHTCVYTQ